MSGTVARGRFVVEDGTEWYRIDDVDRLEPFLVNVVSPYDHWMFVSSSGALTAGRRNAEQALFPYETDDRLHRSGGRTGPITVVRAAGIVWEPFAPHAPRGVGSRSLAKSVAGDRLRFEEHHPGLGLTLRTTWGTSLRHGLVRLCELALDPGADPVEVELLDGLLDVLPAGVELGVQQRASTLVDAYRRTELDAASGLVVMNLEAAISDLPRAEESPLANVVWSRGLPEPTVLLSDRQLSPVRAGESPARESLVRGRKSAFLQAATVSLEPGERLTWVVVGDVALDHGAVARTRRWLLDVDDACAEVASALDASTAELVDLVAQQDGVQRSSDRAADVHHFANVVYNAMRGGAVLDGHRVDLRAVHDAIGVRNVAAAARLAQRMPDLDRRTTIDELRGQVRDDLELLRLVNEYLPLTFSRRHGDPSRPWNRFDIPARAPDGRPVGGYEGNWRDIFQNWEALLHSFPAFAESVVSKFLSASTRDGHNPYRVTHHGIDWEVPTTDSWGNFGYWGDHQIVYLHRLLDTMQRCHPGVLAAQLDLRAYAYADVPYRMRSHAAIVKDPKHTLDFDDVRHGEILARELTFGTDARLVRGSDGNVHHASLAEKLLVPALAKLANLVVGGGIWMNTQRPEWNDANNALVGSGLSVVTAFHLRAYLVLLRRLFGEAGATTVPLDPAVARWLRTSADVLERHAAPTGAAATSPTARRRLLDALGTAYEAYRVEVTAEPPGDPVPVPAADVDRLLAAGLTHVEAITDGAWRDDGLVESYRLLVLGEGTAEVASLYPMLEGQAAALQVVDLEPERAAQLLDALLASALHRQDHDSFMLYPDRELPAFLERNRVPEDAVASRLAPLVREDGGLLYRDVEGQVRFDPAIRDEVGLDAAMARQVPELDDGTRAALRDLYDRVHGHTSFTGRSQSMYRYEGLGSIYWHMVLKLLDGVQRQYHAALAAGAADDVVDRLHDHYVRIRGGLGHRTPVHVQGAFPMDPHSHTPADAGAQQPGMTGAVKESIILRLGELGVRVEDGRVRFAPRLLDAGDVLPTSVPWAPLGTGGRLGAGTLGFTYCGVPVVYHLVEDDPWVRASGPDLSWFDGGDALDADLSRALLARTGEIRRIDVGIRAPAERNAP